jgi:prepilin-type N-terminal cleavage/methylation domain-containing protein
MKHDLLQAWERIELRAPAANARAVTLLEVMIALVIIAIALFAVMSMVLETVATKESLRELEKAKEAVAGKIEEMKSNPFSQVTTTYPSGSSFVVPGLRDPATADQQARGTITIVSNVASDLLDIHVSVQWKGRRGMSTYSMRSLYTQ